MTQILILENRADL